MLRSAWKQWRSCSLDSEAMCADSLASQRLAGWMCSPSASSTVVTGCWASQSISHVGAQPRELLGDGDVTSSMSEPDRRRQIEHPLGSG